MTTDESALSPAGIVGPAAALGAGIGAALGYVIATLAFQPAADASGSLVGWIFDNGFAFAAALIPLFICGALVGWMAVPALVGKMLGWSDLGLAATYQVVLGAIGLPASIWVVGSLDGINERAFMWVSGVIFVLVAAGIPMLSRVMVERRPSSRRSTELIHS